MPDDETVNQMIARHEEEFDLFMVRRRGKGRKGRMGGGGSPKEEKEQGEERRGKGLKRRSGK